MLNMRPLTCLLRNACVNENTLCGIHATLCRTQARRECAVLLKLKAYLIRG